MYGLVNVAFDTGAGAAGARAALLTQFHKQYAASAARRQALLQALHYLSPAAEAALTPMAEALLAELQFLHTSSATSTASVHAKTTSVLQVVTARQRVRLSVILAGAEAGEYCLSVQGGGNERFLHSRVAPRAEATRQAAAFQLSGTECCWVLLGSDLFYGLAALTQRQLLANNANNAGRLPQALVIVVAIPELFFMALMARAAAGNLNWLRHFKRNIHVLMPQTAYAPATGILTSAGAALMRPLNAARGAWLFIPTRAFAETQAQQLPAQLQKQLLTLRQTQAQSVLTRYVFEKRWLKNILSNLGLAGQLYSLKHLAACHLGEAALIVGAGPSLDQAYDMLQDLMRAPHPPRLIALDSAIPTLKTMGIVPHYVVALDGGYYNALDFIWGPAEPPAWSEARPRLLTHLAVHPLILRRYAGPIFVFAEAVSTGGAGLSADIAALLGIAAELQAVQLNIGSSVLQAALACAKFLGFARIGLCGIDLSYPALNTHCFHAVHNEFLRTYATRLSHHKVRAFQHLRTSLVPNSMQSLAPTTHMLKTYAHELEAFVNDWKGQAERATQVVVPPRVATFSPYMQQLNGVQQLNAAAARTFFNVQATAPAAELPPLAAKPLLSVQTLTTAVAAATKLLAAYEQRANVFMQGSTMKLTATTETVEFRALMNFPPELRFLSNLLRSYKELLAPMTADISSASLNQQYSRRQELLLGEELRRLLHMSSWRLQRLLETLQA